MLVQTNNMYEGEENTLFEKFKKWVDLITLKGLLFLQKNNH